VLEELVHECESPLAHQFVEYWDNHPVTRTGVESSDQPAASLGAKGPAGSPWSGVRCPQMSANPSHQEAPDMRAAIGDKIVVRSRRVGEHDREAVILAVEGPDGGPPYRVRWDDDGHEGVFFPGADAVVEHYPVG